MCFFPVEVIDVESGCWWHIASGRHGHLGHNKAPFVPHSALAEPIDEARHLKLSPSARAEPRQIRKTGSGPTSSILRALLLQQNDRLGKRRRWMNRTRCCGLRRPRRAVPLVFLPPSFTGGVSLHLVWLRKSEKDSVMRTFVVAGFADSTLSIPYLT